MRLDRVLKTSWTKKMKLKAEKKSVKEFEKQLKEERNKKLEVIITMFSKSISLTLPITVLMTTVIVPNSLVDTNYY